ncbi:MAG TPA: pentapeptide repeat-containing protein [Cyanophyceae cyanobacterium]
MNKIKLQSQLQEIVEANFREKALRDYMDKIAELMIEKKLKILLKQLSQRNRAKDNPEMNPVVDVARVRTLSILRRLNDDIVRKSRVAYFLIDAELIQDLDLKEANFSNTSLLNANLLEADLINAENLTLEQIKKTQNWEKAYYNPELCKQLGLLSREKP